MMNADLRAMKAFHVHASRSGALWDGIAEKAQRRSASSPSMAMPT